jgi:hypothetical protein
MRNRSISIGPRPLEACRLGLFALAACLVFSFGSTAPACGERLWLDHYRIGSKDAENAPQPSPVLLGCFFPGCFPGFSQQPLRLETSVHGPFLKQWILELQALSVEERGSVTVAGSAEKLSPSGNIKLDRRAGIIDNLWAERAGSLPLLPIKVELDGDAIDRWFSSLHSEPPQLVLEVRYIIGAVEIHRSRIVYDFSDRVPLDVTQVDPAKDHIKLTGYDSSTVVLLAQGGDLAQRKTDLYFSRPAVDVDDMTSATPNVEVAVWSSDNQPVLIRQPELKLGSEDISISAPGLLKLTPNLRLPAGNVVPDIKWADLAKCDYAVANHLFRNNRMGVELQFATAGNSGNTVCEDEATLRGQMGFVQKKLNISYVSEVYDPQTCCSQSVPEAVFITLHSTPTTLAHELAHAFGLTDDEGTQEGTEEGKAGNMMLGGALDRRDFTLPQVYLMMFGAESILNSLGLRQSSTMNTREKGGCLTHCGSGAPRKFIPQCVDLRASFSRSGPPPPAGEIQKLLMALSSEESTPSKAPFDLNDPLARHPGLIPFLKGVAILGPRRENVEAIIRRIRSLLTDQECPIVPDNYVKLYSDRSKVVSQRAAANALFALRTAEAKEALKAVRQSVSGSLREHIGNLLLNWSGLADH